MPNKEIIKTFINDVNRKKDNIIYQTNMKNAQWLKDTLIDSLQYIEQLETKIKELGKGQQALMQSRRKWKNRYYKIRKKNKELQKSVEQIYDDYQDIGKMYFDLDEKRQKLIEKLEEAIDFTKTSKDSTSKAKIEVLENVLKILKEKKKLQSNKQT